MSHDQSVSPFVEFGTGKHEGFRNGADPQLSRFEDDEPNWFAFIALLLVRPQEVLLCPVQRERDHVEVLVQDRQSL